MDIVFLILVFLAMVGLSGVLVRIVPLPLPLVQITLGALLAVMPGGGFHVSLDPELFLLLFVPPLLFADGWRIPKREFFEMKWPILTMAFGLVFFTVWGVGYFVHWLIPAISLPAAFALAAVLSPTDAVAVSAISGRVAVPSRLMQILQGEALLNDASGLVAFKFALLAAVTGVFSLSQASMSFLLISIGGLGVGAALTALFGLFDRWILRERGDDPVTMIIVSLLIPFGAYLIAEHFGWSGILAAVAAGITINYFDQRVHGSIETRLQGATIWAMIEFCFNGVIFLLLGLQLPWIIKQAPADAQVAGGGIWHLLFCVAAISAVLVALRFIWVTLSLHFTLKRAARRGKTVVRPSVKLVVATALAGVRGAVTLAAVLSIPLTLEDKTPFPGRELIIFLAAGVIIISLLLGSFGLPLVLKNFKLSTEDPLIKEERAARLSVSDAALRSLEEVKTASWEDGQAEFYTEIAERLIVEYRHRSEAFDQANEHREQAKLTHQIEVKVRLIALRAQREELFQLKEKKKINDETLNKLMRDIDFQEASLVGTRPMHHG